MQFLPEPHEATIATHDGTGAGDHDQAYSFGRRPTSMAPYPFSERQYARLLVLRGRVRDGVFAADHLHA